MSEIRQGHEPARHFVGIRRSVHHTELAPYFAEVLPAVTSWVQSQGVAPASAPIAVWHAMDPATGMCDVQAGCFVPEALDGEGEITPGATPDSDTLTLTHVGGYDAMGQSWGEVFRHAASLGREAGLGWEIYVDDPGSTPIATLRTEIHLALG